jgi:hypothetical protein
MPAGRKTHDYPHGKPIPIVLLDIAMVIVGVSWVAFASKSWIRAVPLIAVFLAIALVYSKLLRAYERTGEAVRIARPLTVVKFVNGIPGPILMLRYAFFVTVAIMIVFGVARVEDATAKVGIIGCVIGLFVIGFLHLAIEHHYVSTGRAKEVDSSRRLTPPAEHPKQ